MPEHPHLSDEQRRFIVVRLAIFKSASDIRKEFKEQFGFDVSKQTVWKWDFGRIRALRGPEADDEPQTELEKLFVDCRDWYKSNIESIPIANAVGRLNELQEMYEDVKQGKRKNRALMLMILEQAAKESGGVFTNKQKITHEFSNLTDEELIAEAKSLLGGSEAARTAGEDGRDDDSTA